MTGVVLAAGRGARLGSCCKPLLRLQDQLLIHSPLNHLVALGCRTIVIVISDQSIPDTLGKQYKGCRLVYVMQGSPEGTAHALRVAKPLISDSFYLICGDLLMLDSMPSDFFNIADTDYALVLTANLDTTQIKRYAAVYTSENGLIETIVEKPDSPTTSCGEVGFYHFPREILDIPLKRGKRGEFELQSLENALISQGVSMHSVPYSGNWVNVNTPDDLARARALVAAQPDEERERSELP